MKVSIICKSLKKKMFNSFGISEIVIGKYNGVKL